MPFAVVGEKKKRVHDVQLKFQEMCFHQSSLFTYGLFLH